jgi:hypothetical protein
VIGQGYPLETYPVETWDGFILRLYRIPHGVKNATGTGGKPVVVLNHGVTLASDCFVSLDPDSSMGFYLADAGERRGPGPGGPAARRTFLASSCAGRPEARSNCSWFCSSHHHGLAPPPGCPASSCIRRAQPTASTAAFGLTPRHPRL